MIPASPRTPELASTERPVAVPVGADVLPGYRVEALLAHGSRVDTYDVTSLERDCRAVVKVIRSDRRSDEHVRAAVLTEDGELLLLGALDAAALIRLGSPPLLVHAPGAPTSRSGGTT